MIAIVARHYPTVIKVRDCTWSRRTCSRHELESQLSREYTSVREGMAKKKCQLHYSLSCLSSAFSHKQAAYGVRDAMNNHNQERPSPLLSYRMVDMNRELESAYDFESSCWQGTAANVSSASTTLATIGLSEANRSHQASSTSITGWSACEYHSHHNAHFSWTVIGYSEEPFSK